MAKDKAKNGIIGYNKNSVSMLLFIRISLRGHTIYKI